MDINIVFLFLREEFAAVKAPVKCKFGVLDWVLGRRAEDNYNAN